MTKEINLTEIEKQSVESFLESGDFNGIPVSAFYSSEKMDFEKLRAVLLKGIETDRFRIISSDHELNPHIIREGFRDIDAQIKSIRPDNVHHICIYPSKSVLKDYLTDDQFRDSPFERMLAEGSGQLELAFFDLELLEFYRNDPRYYYECNDIGGRICIEDDHYLSESVDEKDKVLIKAFGLAYDEEFNRYLTAFIGDVADLSPEHQNIWRAKQVFKDLKVHPDFYGSQILGRWPTHISVFDAVLYEQKIINEMVRKMGKPNLFNQEFGGYLENKPKEFAFMLRPTAREYELFILLLDKIMSDNINKNFFKGDVALQNEVERKDGKIQVISKSAISLLDEWLRKQYRTTDWAPWDFAISVFKDIRKKRQSPAHSVIENKYDQSLIQKQRDLIKDAWESLSILRHALSNHPACKDQEFEIPKALQESKIWIV